ncbi:high-affinity branched-chain amino acid ABC transporter permease LivM [Hyphomicrobiales bacterium BP6-180914]|uniref:High-affinity branched-chain amino acid ABC transporter permease LivM n=2 Tax=Lichenifustis flavocetrariae TaxID=2949735 RepID=A0AA41YWE0_9HYPH|nr:high-affinity branched-chain amino acid ABC transporter permease LivM [Lichenifustis flavocetrariae]MCW6509354.1 high-affinity branched-chain amino acid ABC transporter permease LivM [Lichenifustis flavocetrariae]
MAAVKDAGFAALVTLGLSFPILAFRTQEDISNHLIVVPRWSWPITAAILVFVGRFAAILFRSRPRATRAPTLPKAPSASATFLIRYASWFGVAALIAFPMVMVAALGAGGSLKWINNYGIQILIYVMLGWGLNIVVGLSGLLDLGYVAFYAVGAYSYALLSTTFGLSFWICLPLAGLLAAFWGIILGFPVLRLRGDYLAIVTLAFGEIIRLVLINWTDLTNGYAGISSIPRATFFGVPFTDDDDGFAHLFGMDYSPIQRTIFLFYLILALALLTNAVTLRLRRLPVGRAWEALREDEIACRSLGINTTNTKLTAFALGAMFGGFAGSFFAVRQGFVSPESFTFIESATILAIVVLGGMGSQIGVALAAVLMIGGTEILRELDFLKAVFGRDFDPVQYRMLIFGAGMVLMMILKPRGIISTRTPSIFYKEQKAISGSLVKEGHG